MKIEVCRIHKLDGDGATKAFVDVVLDDAFIINGLRVVEGVKGLFVSMPREAGKDGKWYNTVIPLKREIKEELDNLVLGAYLGDVVVSKHLNFIRCNNCQGVGYIISSSEV